MDEDIPVCRSIIHLKWVYYKLALSSPRVHSIHLVLSSPIYVWCLLSHIPLLPATSTCTICTPASPHTLLATPPSLCSRDSAAPTCRPRFCTVHRATRNETYRKPPRPPPPRSQTRIISHSMPTQESYPRLYTHTRLHEPHSLMC